MAEGFDKIDLDEKIDINKDSKTPPMRKKKTKFRLNSRVNMGIALVIIIIVLFFFFGIFLPAGKVYLSAKKTQTQAKLVLTSLKQQNIALASDQMAKTKADLADTVKDLHTFSYIKFIPIVNWYYNDASHLLAAGTYAVDGGQLLIDSIKPYADVLGLKGAGTFTGGSAEQRIQTAVMTLDTITPRIDDIEKKLVAAKAEIDAVDPNHYPPIFGIKKIRDQLIQLKTLTDQGATFITDAKPLVKLLPALLGAHQDKKYLVLFQNDKELRATGGFITAYAIFRVEKGTIHVDRSEDIYTLDNSIARHPVAPRPILQYLPQVSTLNIRDTNLSPDFIVSMQEFNKLYEQAGRYQKVDGIIALDTHVLVSAMDILGDMQTASGTFTTKTDARCNCPQVIYALEASADRPVNYVRQDRKSDIGDLTYAILTKALSSSPKKYWAPLFQTMITEANQRHIFFYLYNNDAQKGIEALNAAGRIKNFDGDYLDINDVNFGGAKSNLFVKETVTQNYKVTSDGSIEKTVTIDYKNAFPPSDCNLERGGLCLNAPLRNWLRIYVPKGSQLVDSQGSEVKMITYDELGKTVVEGFMTVRPLGKATVTLTYRLPFKLSNGSPLPLLIQKQGGTDGNQYVIQTNGKKIEEFPLLTDKLLKLNVQ